MNIVTREFKDADIEDEIREAFRVFDKEGNGFITTPDLMEVTQLNIPLYLYHLWDLSFNTDWSEKPLVRIC